MRYNRHEEAYLIEHVIIISNNLNPLTFVIAPRIAAYNGITQTPIKLKSSVLQTIVYHTVTSATGTIAYKVIIKPNFERNNNTISYFIYLSSLDFSLFNEILTSKDIGR